MSVTVLYFPSVMLGSSRVVMDVSWLLVSKRCVKVFMVPRDSGVEGASLFVVRQTL